MPILVLSMGISVSAHAQAQYAGIDALTTLQDMLTGNIGLTLGLGIMVIGLLTIITGKAAAGLIMILGGALLTMSPGIFNGVRSMVYGVVAQFADGNTTSVDPTPSY